MIAPRKITKLLFDVSLATVKHDIAINYFTLTTACAAASLAIGTLNGEHDT